MAALALVLRATLPARRPRTGVPYAELLRSTARLMRQHPALRRRALYQATMFGAFSAFWTTVSFVLTSAPLHYNQLGVGLFALVGAGCRKEPDDGRNTCGAIGRECASRTGGIPLDRQGATREVERRTGE